MASSTSPQLLHLSFNQDHSSFAVANPSGFRIFSCEPFRELFQRDSDDHNEIIIAVEMLFNSNMFAIITRGLRQTDPINRVILWDDSQSRCTNELCFRSQVKSVKLTRDRVVVVLLHKVLVYNFKDLKLLHEIDTTANPKGLCAVSSLSRDSDEEAPMILACPGLRKGQVRVVDYALDWPNTVKTAHDSELAWLALSHNGKRLATASTKGTLIRVFDTADGSLLQEVRRGAERAEIHCLTFSSTGEWLAASSNKGTVHVFKLLNGRLHNASSLLPGSHSLITPSSLSLVKKGVVPKYFSSEWSLAQFRLRQGLRHMVAFGHENNILIILGADGSFYRCRFDPVYGGEMIQLEHHHFLKPRGTS